jgi:protein kinase C substrate 80K-H
LEAFEAKKNKLEAALAPPPPTPDTDSASISDATTTTTQEEEEQQQETGADEDSAAAAATADGIDDQAIAQESAEDIAKRVASQWIPGVSDKEEQPEPAVDYVAEEEEEEEENNDVGNAYEPSLDALASMNAVEALPETLPGTEEFMELDLGPVGSFKAWIAETFAKLLGKPADAAELQRVRATVDAIRSRYEAAKNAFEHASAGVYALKSEREGLETKINRSYGPDDVYAQLVDRCVEANVDKYIYKVCPFDEVRQLEDGSGPRLGSWKGFDDSGEHMLFDNGDVCWQGPNRSMTVRIRCGATETLTKVAEPSRCEYTAEMTTPAACSEDRVKALRAAIAERQALLDGSSSTNSNVKDEL